MGIGNLVQHYEAAGAAGGLEHACDVLFLERQDLERYPLMHRLSGNDPRYDSAIGDLNLDFSPLGLGKQLRGNSLHQKHFPAFARWI